MVSKYPKVATQHIFNDLIWVSQPSPSANIIITTKIINISTSSHSLLCGSHTQTQSVVVVVSLCAYVLYEANDDE